MKIKLLKEFTYQDTVYPVDSILDIEDADTCTQLITDGTAQEYTPEVEAQEQAEVEAKEKELIHAEADKIKIEQKSLKNLAVKSTAGETKKMKGMLGKALKDMRVEVKAVADVSGTTPTEYLGYVAQKTNSGTSLAKCL